MTRKEKISTTVARLANFVLAGGGVVCLLVLSYFVYYYSWTGQRQFASWAGVLLYYVSPVLLAILLFASLRLSASRKINLALCFCSAGISIYALEILLTVWFNLPSVMQDLDSKVRVESAKAAGIDFDTRSKRQVVEDFRSRGVDAVPGFPGLLLKKQNDGTRNSSVRINGLEVLPLAGISNKLTILCNESGQYVTYRSDDHGFNNPQNLWDNAPLDIVAVGDSYVQGWCVPSDKNFVALIQKSYPATLNLGIEGTGPLAMLATLKEYARIVKPKVVLWFYYEGNDLHDLIAESNTPLLMRYLTNGFSQGLFARQPEIDRALTDYIETVKDKNKVSIKLEEISELLGGPTQLPNGIGGIIKLSEVRQRTGLIYGAKGESSPETGLDAPMPEIVRFQIELLGKILSHAKESVSLWGGNLYFVYLPSWGRYTREGNAYRDQVLLAVNSAGLPIIDISRSFATQKDPLALFPFRLHSHYNEEGHQLVAQEVLRSISVGK